ncbi:hypothetical protein H7Y63_02295 [Polaromonas sp.]|nr:hypothetical protein [Candidatus Saccharibacteria bacterium]
MSETFVGGGDNSNGPRNFGRFRVLLARKKLIFILLLIVGAVAAILYMKAQESYVADSGIKARVGICSVEVIKDASGALNKNDLTALSQLESQITKTKNYELDPNCLFILTRSAAATGDEAAAQRYLEALNKVYDPKIGYSTNFTIQTYDPSTLKKIVTFVTEREKGVTEQRKAANKKSSYLNQAADAAVEKGQP